VGITGEPGIEVGGVDEHAIVVAPHPRFLREGGVRDVGIEGGIRERHEADLSAVAAQAVPASRPAEQQQRRRQNSKHVHLPCDARCVAASARLPTAGRAGGRAIGCATARAKPKRKNWARKNAWTLGSGCLQSFLSGGPALAYCPAPCAGTLASSSSPCSSVVRTRRPPTHSGRGAGSGR